MQEYTVKLANGFVTTMLLDDDDAKRYGDAAKPVATKAAAAPANKAVKPENK